MCLFICVCPCVNLSLFQLHPELSAVPEQHDSGGLHDGSGCSVPAGDRWSPRPQITVPCRLPGNIRKRQRPRGARGQEEEQGWVFFADIWFH